MPALPDGCPRTALQRSGRSSPSGQTPTNRLSRQARRCCTVVTGSCPPCRPSVSREPALKLMETLRIPACAYELEEFLHGPNLHLTPNHTLFFLASDPQDRERGAQLSRAAGHRADVPFHRRRRRSVCAVLAGRFTDASAVPAVFPADRLPAHGGPAPLAQAPAGGGLRVRRQRKK